MVAAAPDETTAEDRKPGFYHPRKPQRPGGAEAGRRPASSGTALLFDPQRIDVEFFRIRNSGRW